ncbi:unnamed protein product [Brugia timori]|uniref:Uncharacterized protein n=1 Tax=Brugia timori TaxID=42155 RepID=A0A3P7T716_9BILA|nr:unnamed protein product [Brugia timori]
MISLLSPPSSSSSLSSSIHRLHNFHSSKPRDSSKHIGMK